MRRGFWLAALLLAPAGAFAQQAATRDSTFQGDLPDNSGAFTRDTSGVSKTPPPDHVAAPNGAQQAQEAAQAAPAQNVERELRGTVVRAEPRQVWLDYMGVLVPFDVTPQTRFEGVTGARVDALAPGQEVRARYNIAGGRNVATDLQLAPASPAAPNSGRGGSGQSGGASRDPIDTDARSPSLVPSTGEVKGPANPIP